MEVHHVLVVPEKLENEICGIKDKFLEQNYTNALCVHSCKEICVCMYVCICTHRSTFRPIPRNKSEFGTLLYHSQPVTVLCD